MRYDTYPNEWELWRDWFAWHPVTLTNGKRAWLRWIEMRHRLVLCGMGGTDDEYQYRNYRNGDA